jgi:pimeloyl-ACP methyl ester carboxylesterase
MAARFVLIHSPSVGPRTWQPVAHRLAELGWEAIVPSLLHVTDQGRRIGPRVVDAVRAGLGTAEQGQGLVLVAHSNAGLFLPAITAALPGQVRGCIFVDAAVPPGSGAALVAPPELLGLLRDKATDGLLPRWTDWWDEEEVVALFPDQAIRQAVTEEQPRLPLSYYEASVPVPAGWDAQRCAYLLFGPPMTSWPARHVVGAGSSSSFQVGICTSWLTLMVSPGRCWRSPTRWGSPSPNR